MDYGQELFSFFDGFTKIASAGDSYSAFSSVMAQAQQWVEIFTREALGPIHGLIEKSMCYHQCSTYRLYGFLS
jgi:hypothetical protein